ncbi:hypothetical protein HKX48_004299 [Thoreauomyces humboldtii]|nr:hypothetical protein HKX48_004299 [Thoreauomyces humboldtii]
MSLATKPSVSSHMHILGGGVSGLAACVLLQPLDLVKTRLQQHHSTLPPLPMANAPLLARSTLWSVATQVVRSESLTGLWRGTVPTIFRNVPGSALYFGCLERSRSILGALGVGRSTANLAAGAGSRVAVGLLLMPITVVKVRFESDLYRYKTVLGAVRGIVADGGVRGLFAGSGATVLRDAPHAGLYVLFYEHSKTLLKAALPPSAGATPTSTWGVHMAAAGASGIAATVATNPFDVLKTRMQLDPARYATMPATAWKIATEERISGFFAGMLPRLLRKTVSAAITWTIYEEIVRWAGNRVQ